jgi:hypothetical protein
MFKPSSLSLKIGLEVLDPILGTFNWLVEV